MTHILRAGSPRDFLALVPEIAGYHPVQSLLLVAFTGTRSCGVLRFDLPSGEDREVSFASTAIGVLCRLPRADAVVPIVYTDDVFGQATELPRSALLTEVVERAGRAGFLVRSALVLAADGWGSLFEDDRPCGGHPRSGIVFSDRSGVTGKRIGDIGDGAELPAVSEDARERVAARLAAMDRTAALQRIPGADTDPIPAIVGFFEAALDPFRNSGSARGPERALSDDAAALLVALLSASTLRDVALIEWAFGVAAGEAVLSEGIMHAFGGPPRSSIAADLLWGEGPRPDAGRVAAATALLGVLAARSPRERRPQVLTMLAWLSWAVGRSTVAGRFVDLALEIDPGHVLADIIHGMLVTGHLPGWAFRE